MRRTNNPWPADKERSLTYPSSVSQLLILRRSTLRASCEPTRSSKYSFSCMPKYSSTSLAQGSIVIKRLRVVGLGCSVVCVHAVGSVFKPSLRKISLIWGPDWDVRCGCGRGIGNEAVSGRSVERVQRGGGHARVEERGWRFWHGGSAWFGQRNAYNELRSMGRCEKGSAIGRCIRSVLDATPSQHFATIATVSRRTNTPPRTKSAGQKSPRAPEGNFNHD